MREKFEAFLKNRTALSFLFVLILTPITIYIGIRYFGDRRYIAISLALAMYAMIPFFVSFEQRKPEAREIVVISVLCAIASIGRAIFFMLPQFKPVAAITIIAGVSLGPASGFLTGAMSGFVSNFFFGQGPWTPWQMFAYGLIGFLSGAIGKRGEVKSNRLVLCSYGALCACFIYGPIADCASLLMFTSRFSWGAYLALLLSGLWFNLIHAGATFFFLWFLGPPMLQKLMRLKTKFGLME